MGDNRYQSKDSRYNQDQPGKGFVPEDEIVGRAFVLNWPLNRFGLLDSYSDVFAGARRSTKQGDGEPQEGGDDAQRNEDDEKPKEPSRVRALAPDPEKDPTLAFEHEQLERYPDYLGVIGLDEAGRGAIAGPVSVGAHVVQRGTTSFPEGLRDSKLLSEARREWIFPTVLEWGVGAVGFGQPGDIDEHGITTMLGRAGRDALLSVHEQGIDVRKCLIVVDGSHDWLSEALLQPLHVVTRVGADRLRERRGGFAES